jgi:multicomponent Na+:H+ antiporter subunit D
MSAGAVMYQTGRRKCTDLGGLYRSMPLTMTCGMIGALAISAFPLTSGFISKSLISEAAGRQGLELVWLLLTAASAGVFLHAGIKFPWFVFFHRDSGLRPADPPWNMRAAMLLFAGACIVLGCFPGLLYPLLPYPVDYVPYTATHVVTQLQLLLFAGLAFFVMLSRMERTLTVTLDLDWFYRVLLVRVAAVVERTWDWLLELLRELRRDLRTVLGPRFEAWFLPHGRLAQTWPTGSMTLWVTVILVLLVVLAQRDTLP